MSNFVHAIAEALEVNPREVAESLEFGGWDRW